MGAKAELGFWKLRVVHQTGFSAFHRNFTETGYRGKKLKAGVKAEVPKRGLNHQLLRPIICTILHSIPMRWTTNSSFKFICETKLIALKRATLISSTSLYASLMF